MILVDTREQNPFDFSRFEGWFTGIEKRALKLGDYSIAALEDHRVVERTELADLVHPLTTERSMFVNRLRLMSRYPHRLLVITASLSEDLSQALQGPIWRHLSPITGPLISGDLDSAITSGWPTTHPL